MNIKIILITGLLLISIISCGSATIQYDNCPFNITNYVTTVDHEQYFKSVVGSGYENITIIVYGKTKCRYEYTDNSSNRLMTTKTYVATTGMGYTFNYSTSDSVYFSTDMNEGTVMYAYSSAYAKHKYIGIWSFYNGQIKTYSTPGYGNVAITQEIIEGSVLFVTEDQNIYNVSGNTSCLDWIKLYQNDNLIAFKELNSTNFNYTFLLLNGTYKLNFSDEHEYEFTIDGSNITYDYDACSYITLNFKDNCNNLIRKTAGTYYNSGDPFALNFYAPNGTYDILFKDQEYLELWVDSAAGTLYYNISSPKKNSVITYTILNPIISWNNNIYVIDGNTSLPIKNALVMFSQDCIIVPTLYPSRNKFTNTSGLVIFRQCELDSFSLGISATDYKSFSDNNISSNNLSAFLLEQTVVVKLYLSTDENESEYDYTDYGTWINFKDVNGNYTTSILDTDNYVDLYYYNNNTEDVAMALKFQKYSISTGFTTLLSWDIPKETNGYKRILKSNYTDTLSSYKGYLYNYSIEGWDRIKYLAVRNETSEIDLDYQNLTSYTWFVNKNIEGSIDYHEDINIIAYANTSYVGLFNISLELYDNSSFVTHTNLTWADFTTADLKYFYEWKPTHSYANGHNYTVRMHGYDHYLLDLDYINATDYRKNKLTILVKNQYGTDLINCFIYLEDYGSLSTHTNNYNSYENLDNGYYRYKATKPDYVGTGWSDITLSDSDEIVTYVLTWSGSEEGSAMQQQKISDSDLSNIYLILMAIILIFIILGGFIYATK